MSTTREQAEEIKRLSKLVLSVDQPILREAITTLLAAALIEKKLSVTDDLIRITEEFCADAPSMDLTEVVNYQNDLRGILKKLK